MSFLMARSAGALSSSRGSATVVPPPSSASWTSLQPRFFKAGGSPAEAPKRASVNVFGLQKQVVQDMTEGIDDDSGVRDWRGGPITTSAPLGRPSGAVPLVGGRPQQQGGSGAVAVVVPPSDSPHQQTGEVGGTTWSTGAPSFSANKAAYNPPLPEGTPGVGGTPRNSKVPGTAQTSSQRGSMVEDHTTRTSKISWTLDNSAAGSPPSRNSNRSSFLSQVGSFFSRLSQVSELQLPDRRSTIGSVPAPAEDEEDPLPSGSGRLSARLSTNTTRLSTTTLLQPEEEYDVFRYEVYVGFFSWFGGAKRNWLAPGSPFFECGLFFRAIGFVPWVGPYATVVSYVGRSARSSRRDSRSSRAFRGGSMSLDVGGRGSVVSRRSVKSSRTSRKLSTGGGGVQRASQKGGRVSRSSIFGWLCGFLI